MATKSPFSEIPSQLEQIPEDMPIVFISYSWDSAEHKQWVSDLSKDLREKFRVYTLLDQYNTRVRDKKRLVKVGNLVKNSYLYR